MVMGVGQGVIVTEEGREAVVMRAGLGAVTMEEG